MLAIEFNGVTKNYGKNIGIENASFKINQGDCVLFYGANGSGKTTVIKLILGFLTLKHSDKGKISVANIGLGYLPERIILPRIATAKEFVYNICMLSTNNVDNTLFEYFELPENVMISAMSKGMQQKLGLIQLGMVNGDILILDEPMSGLDEKTQLKVLEYVKALNNKGKTIILSTHYHEKFRLISNRFFYFENHRMYEQIT